MGAVKRTHPDAVKNQLARKMIRRLKQSFCDKIGWPVRGVTFKIKEASDE